MLYGELEHAHCHVQPEKMEEKSVKKPEMMEEKSVKTKLLLHLSFPDKWTPEAKSSIQEENQRKKTEKMEEKSVNNGEDGGEISK